MSKSEPLQGHTRYIKLRDINKGAFGFVQMALDVQTDTLVAIKCLPRGKKITDNVEREVKNHRVLCHPHIIIFKEVFLTQYHLCIVMEYADRGDLHSYIVKRGRLSESQARWIFQQLLFALEYLHFSGVVMRDIKLENLLLVGDVDKPLLKMCDFGYAKHEELQSAPHSQVGTLAYIAPEILGNQPGESYDGKAADAWSCGVVLYVMLVGKYPFERASDNKLQHSQKVTRWIQRTLKADYIFPEDVPMCPELKDLLGKIFVADPSGRITISDIFDHPWHAASLPQELREFNRQKRDNQATSQTAEEVDRILKAAREPAVDPSEGGSIQFFENHSA